MKQISATQLIYDDAFAMQFQTLAQYRKALLDILRNTETDRVRIEVELGDMQMLLVDADKESVTFDQEEIVNGGGGPSDGFELTWKEIYYYCKESFEKEKP